MARWCVKSLYHCLLRQEFESNRLHRIRLPIVRPRVNSAHSLDCDSQTLDVNFRVKKEYRLGTIQLKFMWLCISFWYYIYINYKVLHWVRKLEERYVRRTKKKKKEKWRVAVWVERNEEYMMICKWQNDGAEEAENRSVEAEWKVGGEKEWAVKRELE